MKHTGHFSDRFENLIDIILDLMIPGKKNFALINRPIVNKNNEILLLTGFLNTKYETQPKIFI